MTWSCVDTTPLKSTLSQIKQKTSPCTIINETVKWITSLPHPNVEIVLVVTVYSVRYKLALSPLPSYCRNHFCEPDFKLDWQQQRRPTGKYVRLNQSPRPPLDRPIRHWTDQNDFICQDNYKLDSDYIRISTVHFCVASFSTNLSKVIQIRVSVLCWIALTLENLSSFFQS